MHYNTIKEAFETGRKGYLAIADILEYLETCVTENRDINGKSTIPFGSIAEIVDTYLEGIDLSAHAWRVIYRSASTSQILRDATTLTPRV